MSEEKKVLRVEREICVECGVSKKSGNVYYAMYVDLGYTRKYLSWDTSVIAEVLGISVPDLIDQFKGE